MNDLFKELKFFLSTVIPLVHLSLSLSGPSLWSKMSGLKRLVGMVLIIGSDVLNRLMRVIQSIYLRSLELQIEKRVKSKIEKLNKKRKDEGKRKDE